MKIGNPQLILDPYEWLPGYGESKISFRSLGTDVIIDVDYEKDMSASDSKHEATALCRREITFKNARYFFKSAFPGSIVFEFERNSKKFSVGKLIEFVDSEFAKDSLRVWESMSGSNTLKVRHFCIQFLSENVGFHVLAEEVFLSDELLIN